MIILLRAIFKKHYEVTPYQVLFLYYCFNIETLMAVIYSISLRNSLYINVVFSLMNFVMLELFIKVQMLFVSKS